MTFQKTSVIFRYEATQPICDGSLFNDAYAAVCVIDLS